MPPHLHLHRASVSTHPRRHCRTSAACAAGGEEVLPVGRASACAADGEEVLHVAAERVSGLSDFLVEAGRRISDTKELLSNLDRTENILRKVKQSPSPSILDALRPAREVLVAKNLLGHSNLEVKVAVASCVSEIIRITAPDAPYDDDQMKVIFQLIVETFGKLDDISSRSFPRRVLILEAMAQLRVCLVMLDLECDALILDMFHVFLKTIRPNHPEIVFSSMELIMSLVLEESEDISAELISCLLNSVKKNNKEFLPCAHRLGEEVICNSAAKLKPFLENSGALEHNEINSSGQILDQSEDVTGPFDSEEDSEEVGGSNKKITGKQAPLNVGTSKSCSKYKEKVIAGMQEKEKEEVRASVKVQASLDRKGKVKAGKYTSLSELYARSPRV